MAELPDALIDIYLSDQWRIHGGPRNKSIREELRDRLIPVVMRGFGCVDSSLDVLLKESPCSNGRGIRTLIRAYELYFLRSTREAVEAHDEPAQLRATDLRRQFGELDKYETEKLSTATPDNEKICAILRTNVCHLFAQPPDPTQIFLGLHLEPKPPAGGTTRRRGRRPNPERRDAIRNAISKHGDQWRDHLDEIFKELDRQEVPLGDFQGTKIDLGDGHSVKVSKWEDLELAEGEQRRQIVDVIRKYMD
jgi:hypothetical protein